MTITQCPPLVGPKGYLRAVPVAVLTLTLPLVGEGCVSDGADHVSENQSSITSTSLALGPECPAHTPAFWRANPAAWPVESLTIGSIRYTAPQLLAILETNGSLRVRLTQELIAALLDAASGTDSTRIAGTIADANTLLASTANPPHDFFGTGFQDLLRTIEDLARLAEFTSGQLTHTCAAPPGSCEAWGDVSLLVVGRDVVAYVGDYQFDGVNNTVSGSGISVLNIEGARVTPTVIPTPDTVDSCATNAFTGRTVCSSPTNVYLVSGTTLEATLTGGASHPPSSGEYNQGVMIDPIADQAVVGLATTPFLTANGAGFQFLDLGASPSFEPPIPPVALDAGASPGGLLDPFRHLVIDPTNSFGSVPPWQLIDVTTPRAPVTYLGGLQRGEMVGEDCSTGFVVSSFLPPAAQQSMQTLLYELPQVTFTPGSPSGTWSAPVGAGFLSETGNAGWGEFAVAQGTHMGIAAPKLASENSLYPIVALALPATAGTGTPALVDWVDCPFPFESVGPGPQGLTAYESPNTGHAMAVVVDIALTQVAVVDLTQMLDPTVVPRTAAGHGCAAGSLPASVVRIVSMP